MKQLSIIKSSRLCMLLLSIMSIGSALLSSTEVFASKPLSKTEVLNASFAEVVITGKVTDEKDQPMPGVTLHIKGTDIGVVTNEKGKYIITAPTETSVLVVTSVGYQEQDLEINGRKTINIKLEPANTGLNAVEVVGYGTQKRISVTAAISSVPAADLQRIATPSLSNAIGGRLPGVITQQSSGEPGYDAAQVYIRGLGTWVNAAPLVLVDGVERDMNTISSEEIASFTILKDASATAVYGVRGANGVILIETKRGKVGKPTVTFRTENAELTPLRLPQYINGYQYASLMNEALANDGQRPRWTPAELQKYKDGSDPYLYPNINWTDVILKRHTHQTINNLNVSGGSQIMRYFMNIGYTLEDGIYKVDALNQYNTNAQLKRYNFRGNIDVNLSKSFTVNLDLGGIIQSRNYPGSSSGSILYALNAVPPIEYPVKNPDGTPGGAGTYIGQNPWGVATQSGYQHQDFENMQSTLNVKWDLSNLVTPGLSVNGKMAYDRNDEVFDNYNKTFEVKRYMGKDSVTGQDIYTVFRDATPLGLSVTDNSNRAIYEELDLNYQRTFGKHDVTGMILYNQRDYMDLTAGNIIGTIPFRSQGIAGRTTYGYGNRYLAEFDFGYNGSQNFPKGRKFGFFPSISAGWIISNEKFWHVRFISSLKIRGSYGKVGNDQVGGSRFLFLSSAYTNGTPYPFGLNPIWYNGMGESTTGNPNVTWETAYKTNLGLDLELLDGKVTLQANVFNEDRKNILMQRQAVPSFVGLPSSSIPYGNIGRVNNKGVDGMLEIKNGINDRNHLYYSFRGTFTYAHNTVLANDEPTPKYPYLSQNGYPIGQPFGYVAMGLFQNTEEINKGPRQTFKTNVIPGDVRYRDINGDGVIDAYDQVAIGYPRTPEIMYGFGGTIAYKGFDLSLFFTGTAHTSMFFNDITLWAFAPGFGNMNVLQEYYNNRWTTTSTNAKYPIIHAGNDPNNYQLSTLWQRNASYLRFQNAEIGYTLPPSLTKRVKINNARFFVNSTNIFTWDHIKIVSPEAAGGALGGYPLQRIINAGLQINF